VLTEFLLANLRLYRGRCVLLSILSLAQVTGTLLLPTFNAYIINRGVVKGDIDYIVRIGIVMICVTLGQALAQLGVVFIASRVATSVGRDLRSRMFRRVQDFSERDVGRFGPSSLVTRSVNDVGQVQNLVIAMLNNMIPIPVTIIGAFVLAANLDIPMSFMLVGAMVAVTFSALLILGRMGPWYGKMQQNFDRINRVLREQITGAQVVRAFVMEDRERRRFGRENIAVRDASRHVGMLIVAIPPAVILTMNLFSVLLIFWGANRIGDSKMEPGTLNALLSYMGFCVMAITMAIIVFASIPRARVSAGRITEVLSTVASVPEPAQAIDATIAHGLLEMRSATLSFPDSREPALRDIDLRVGPGDVVGVLGRTGSGKTTLLNLASRLYDPTAGSVLVNGIDARLIAESALPRIVSLVPQRPYLFSGTIESNLRFGQPNAAEDELWRALDVVHARGFVEDLPRGLQTPTDQGGSELSGGQRQRLAIARALLCQCDIYLLDDCFSALDAETAAEVQYSLIEELSSKAVVMVTQRVSMVRAADHIIVLDQGRIVESGTHEELEADSETYRDIAESQLMAIAP
jgi:ATP-binding cassette subfamily B multidrug efflux pump